MAMPIKKVNAEDGLPPQRRGSEIERPTPQFAVKEVLVDNLGPKGVRVTLVVHEHQAFVFHVPNRCWRDLGIAGILAMRNHKLRLAVAEGRAL